MIKRCFNCKGNFEETQRCSDLDWAKALHAKNGYQCSKWDKASELPPRDIIVYVASPFRSDSVYGTKLNIEMAKSHCREVISSGAIPYAPHLLFPQFMQDADAEERSLALQMGITMLSHCDELWVFGDTISEGMRAEIEAAEKLHIPVVYINKR